MRGVRLFTWLMISVTWVVGLFILLLPVGIQIDYFIFIIYCLIGPVVTGDAIACMKLSPMLCCIGITVSPPISR
jgi:hypothetical protein